LIPTLLLTLLRNVIEKLTGNAALPTPPVALTPCVPGITPTSLLTSIVLVSKSASVNSA